MRKKIKLTSGKNLSGSDAVLVEYAPNNLLEHMVNDHSKHYGSSKKTVSHERKNLEFEPVNAEWFKNIYTEIPPARRKKYLTQRQLAHFLHTSQSMISLLESGKGNPTVEFLERLFQALGITIEIRVRY